MGIRTIFVQFRSLLMALITEAGRDIFPNFMNRI